MSVFVAPCANGGDETPANINRLSGGVRDGSCKPVERFKRHLTPPETRLVSRLDTGCANGLGLTRSARVSTSLGGLRAVTLLKLHRDVTRALPGEAP